MKHRKGKGQIELIFKITDKVFDDDLTKFKIRHYLHSSCIFFRYGDTQQSIPAATNPSQDPGSYFFCSWMANSRVRGHLSCHIPILGDPGAVSGGGRKAKRARKKIWRRKVKNESRSPWDSSLNRPVPKPFKSECP